MTLRYGHICDEAHRREPLWTHARRETRRDVDEPWASMKGQYAAYTVDVTNVVDVGRVLELEQPCDHEDEPNRRWSMEAVALCHV